MSYPAYPSYKDSGVEWLGDIPTHWKATPLFGVLKERGVVNHGIKTENVLSVLKDVGVINYEDKGDVGNKKSEDISRYKIVETGDIVVNSMNAIFGSVGVAREDGALSPVYIVLTPRTTKFNTDFYGYVFQSRLFQQSLKRIGYGILEHRMRIPMTNLKREVIPEPSRAEQDTLVAFLNQETAKIDILISKQQQLIETLHEKRQALISHVVTKGLNPDVPMRDSGNEWLGEIPSHWRITRLKHRSPSVTVGIVVTPAKYYEDEGIACLRSLNIKEGHIDDNNLVYISASSNIKLSKSILNKSDLVAVRTGQPGTTAVVNETYHGCNCIDLIIIRQSQHFLSTFMCYFLNSDAAKIQYSSGSEGAIQQHFNVETAKNLIVPELPVSEQAKIVHYLDQQTLQIDILIKKSQQTFEILQERRSSLISAAVTGKIDVRAYGNHEP